MSCMKVPEVLNGVPKNSKGYQTVEGPRGVSWGFMELQGSQGAFRGASMVFQGVRLGIPGVFRENF